jgi:hypothetical protein
VLFSKFRKRILPAAHRPPFDPHERVLAWAMTTSDDAVIATNLGLWIADARAGWHEISKAKWDGNVLTIIPSRVVEARDGYDVIEDLHPVRLVLVDPNHLPHQVHLRVTGSVQHPRQCSLGWLAARRVPSKDGLSWIVRYDPGVEREAAEVVAETDAIFKETYWRIVGGSE